MKQIRVTARYDGEVRHVVDGVRVDGRTPPGRMEVPLDATVRVLRGWLRADGHASFPSASDAPFPCGTGGK